MMNHADGWVDGRAEGHGSDPGGRPGGRRDWRAGQEIIQRPARRRGVLSMLVVSMLLPLMWPF